MRSTEEILNRLRISEVYASLGGPKLRGKRGQAFWRKGDGFNVSLDDARGVWHDFTSGDGGGVLDLIVRARGGNRADALRWCADLAGVPLEDKPLSPAEREAWSRERRDLERALPAARYWQRAALSMMEELLDSLKLALADSPATGEVADVERTLASLRRRDGALLIAEYQWWLEKHPGMTAALVLAAQRRERAQRRAVLAYFRQVEEPGRAEV